MIIYNNDYVEEISKIIDRNDLGVKFSGKTILITGATGMICSAVVDILLVLKIEHKNDVSIILAGRSKEKVEKRFNYATEGRDYSFLFYDATGDGVIDCNADYIIHGASNATPSVFATEPVETILANVLGLNRLLDCAKNGKCKRLLYISSSEVYGKIDENRQFKEEDYGYVDILNMRSAYPCAKRTAENLCIAYSKEHGLDTVIVRPGHIYGPTITDNDNRAAAEFARNAAEKEDIVMKSPGTQLRSYCYVFDCASAILTVLDCGSNGNAYNISNKDSICTVSNLAHAFAKAAGQAVIYQDATDMEKLGYNKMTNSSLDATKLEQLGWSPSFSLEEGTRKTLLFYKKTEAEKE